MNRILVSILGLAALAISMSAAGQTTDGGAKLSHPLPLLIDGGGYRTTLLVTNVADQANRCTLNLLDDRLGASDFETHRSVTWNGSSATIVLPNTGSRVSFSGRNLASSIHRDSAVLNCDLPAVVRVMVTLGQNDAVGAAAVLPSAQTGERFGIPVLTRFGDYLFAAQNRQPGEVNCRIELFDESGVVVAERSHDFSGSTTEILYLSELAPAPAAFGGGSATVSCDRQIAVTGFLAGSALSGLPPAVLPSVRTGAGFAPIDSEAFDRLVVGKRTVNVDDSRSYIEFTAAGQFVDVEPGARYTGTYTYVNTGPDTGTLTANYADGDTCTNELTFTSATTGSTRFACTGGETGGGNWRLDDSPPSTGGGGDGGGNTEIPMSPVNVQYVRDDSTAVVSWDAVQDADYYNIYHDDFFSAGCRVDSSGSASFCDEIAANVTGTSHTHASPDDDRNYYWVVACNAGGCSEIGGDPAEFIDTRPAAPQNVSYVRDGSTTVLSWDAVAGADYYKIYHDDFWSSGCRLNSSGSSSFCDELAANVTGTSYTHANPDDDENYYWVVACNAGGCSEIDGDSPAEFIDTRPAAPGNVRASRNGSSATLSWSAAAGANYYKIYHDDFWSSGCRLNSSGSPSFCDELAANVTGTSYTHANPDDDENYYWVVACNAGGCSEIDGDNPTVLSASSGNTGGGGNGGGGDGSGSDDHGDDRVSATLVDTESDTQGSLSAGDLDYFHIEVSGSGTLEAYTSSDIDTVGQLESADGALVRSNDDGGTDLNFRISETVTVGTYFIQVKGYDSDDTGSYTLHVRFNAEGGGTGTGASIPGHPSVTGRFSPPSSTIGQRVRLILDWNEVPGATNYEVKVDDSPTFYTRTGTGRGCSVSGSVTTHSTSYTHEFTATSFDNFYYTVQACNSAGCSCPP